MMRIGRTAQQGTRFHFCGSGSPSSRSLRNKILQELRGIVALNLEIVGRVSSSEGQGLRGIVAVSPVSSLGGQGLSGIVAVSPVSSLGGQQQKERQLAFVSCQIARFAVTLATTEATAAAT